MGHCTRFLENPKYNGGAWHIEGMRNENICASGIYYYASDNITESRLAFRQAVCEPGYEQSDDAGVEHFYGLENEGTKEKISQKFRKKKQKTRKKIKKEKTVNKFTLFLNIMNRELFGAGEFEYSNFQTRAKKKKKNPRLAQYSSDFSFYTVDKILL